MLHSKRAASVLLVIVLLAIAACAQAATTIPGTLTRDIPFKASYEDHPVIAGESTTTGLRYDGTYVPILVVYDNAEGARPLVGIAQADIVLQVPNAGAGATKLVALFADNIPTQAGSIRSARVPYIQLREVWGAALVYKGGPGSETNDDVDIRRSMRKYDVYNQGLSYNLISAQRQYESTVAGKYNAYNAMANLQDIKATLLAEGKQFTPKPGLFADAMPTGIDPATDIEIAHFSHETSKKQGHPASWARFTYDAAQNAYAREVNTGVFADYSDPETALTYTNLIVMRMKYRYTGNYVLLPQFAGQGAADIFIGGQYIAGGWVHKTEDSRFVFVDANGDELALLRGNTFIVIANEYTRVTYSTGN